MKAGCSVQVEQAKVYCSYVCVCVHVRRLEIKTHLHQKVCVSKQKKRRRRRTWDDSIYLKQKVKKRNSDSLSHSLFATLIIFKTIIVHALIHTCTHKIASHFLSSLTTLDPPPEEERKNV